MRDSLKLQCKIDDLIENDWIDRPKMGCVDVVEALICVISDLVDDMECKDELDGVLELFEGVVDDIESKLEDLGEAEEEEEEEKEENSGDWGVGPFLCKIHFKKKPCSKEGCQCECSSK